jgi:hypothetical protein
MNRRIRDVFILNNFSLRPNKFSSRRMNRRIRNLLKFAVANLAKYKIIKFAFANLAKYRIASRRMNRRIRDVFILNNFSLRPNKFSSRRMNRRIHDVFILNNFSLLPRCFLF